MTALRPIRPLIGPECQLVPSDLLDTKTTVHPIRAAVGGVYLMMVSIDGLSS
jgi:hypothetical protein